MPADHDHPVGAEPSGARRVASEPSGHTSGAPRRVAAEDSSGMGRAVGWTILGTILPGVGLWRSGRRVVGSLVMAVALLLVGGLAVFAATNPRRLAALAVDPTMLRGIAIGLLVLAVLWVTVIGASHLALRPAHATTGQRLAGAALVGALSFVVAAPLAFSANVAYSTSGLFSTVFADSDEGQSATEPTITNKVDPWAEKDRLNILLLGGDSGVGRNTDLGVRTDTVIVASIDTATGFTTLFSLPRQTGRMPFPADSPLSTYYPNGFYDGVDGTNSDYFLSSMYRNVPQRVPPEILGKTQNLAADVMKISVGEALGLSIDYYVLVDLDGFRDMINALGGITLNVNYRIPIGGDTDRKIPPRDWIEPGPDQHMSGNRALWYARGRYSLDDYSRMERQRCVINAVVQQVNPQNVLLNFEKVATAGEKTLQTDVPQSMLQPMLELALRVQGTTMRSIVFKNGVDGFRTANPDWSKVKSRVKAALKETVATNADQTPSATPSASGSTSPSGSPTAKSTTKTTKPKSEDLDSECAYNPKD